MSQPPSSFTFWVFFNAALQDYEDKIGSRLIDHPLAKELQECDSVESITTILEEQARIFCEFRDHEKLVNLLRHLVDVLSSPFISTVFDQGTDPVSFPPAKAIFAGIAILLAAVKDVSASYDALIDLFSSFEKFLSKLSIYTEIPLTQVLKKVLVEIIVELLSILALATQQVKKGGFKKLLKEPWGENVITAEAIFQRLDRLTMDEVRATATQTLEVIYGLVRHSKDIMDDADSNESAANISCALEDMQDIVSRMNEEKWDRLHQRVRAWLSPPDPWKNHYFACDSRHSGTGAWWVQSDAYASWKSSGSSSLLWVHGKPGAGKSVICSTIIEDIRTLEKLGLASLAFFYCDFRDDQKKDRHGLLSSLLVQLGEQSDAYSTILSELLVAHFYDSHHKLLYASDSELADCLKDMLKLPGQATVYIVIDALDECPVTTGSQFPREKVLDMVEDLVNLQIPNLRICITSRPEANILPVLEPLAFYSISLHSEDGQGHDIAEYVKSFVHNDREMRRWKATDKQLVIEVLTRNADGMFRWVFCQLVYLRRCIPACIRRALDEIPVTLDETYARALKEIDKSNWGHVHRLFQCVMAASRPFRVEELAEFLALDFDAGPTPAFLADWRPEDLIHTVLFTCSSLLAVVELAVVDNEPTQISPGATPSYRTPRPESPAIPSPDLGAQAIIPILRQGPQRPFYMYPISPPLPPLSPPPRSPSIVSPRSPPLAAQFTHFSVKEYLTSARLAEGMGAISRFHVSMAPAHTTIAQACLGVLLHLDENITEDVLEDFPLAEYAAEHWVNHARFENVASNVLDGMKRLFDPSKNHLSVWVWIYDPELPSWYRWERPERPETARATPLHYAASCDLRDIATFLIVERSQDVNARGFDENETPLHVALRRGHADVARVLLEHGADTEARDGNGRTPLLLALQDRHAEVARVLLEHGANIEARDSDGFTLLLRASRDRNVPVGLAQVLLEHGADTEARDIYDRTPLLRASHDGHVELARVLLEHGANTEAWDNDDCSPLEWATLNGHVGLAQVLLEHGADVNAQNKRRHTPLHCASAMGQPAVAVVLLRHGADLKARCKSDHTPLHCAKGEEVTRLLLDQGADANALDIQNRTPLHYASELGRVEPARVLLEHGVDANTRDANDVTPLHLATGPVNRSSDGEYLAVVLLLIQHGSDIHARDDMGRTAFMRAEETGQLLLENYVWAVNDYYPRPYYDPRCIL